MSGSKWGRGCKTNRCIKLIFWFDLFIFVSDWNSHTGRLSKTGIPLRSFCRALIKLRLWPSAGVSSIFYVWHFASLQRQRKQGWKEFRRRLGAPPPAGSECTVSSNCIAATTPLCHTCWSSGALKGAKTVTLSLWSSWGDFTSLPPPSQDTILLWVICLCYTSLLPVVCIMTPHHKDLCQPLVGSLFLKLKGTLKAWSWGLINLGRNISRLSGSFTSVIFAAGAWWL